VLFHSATFLFWAHLQRRPPSRLLPYPTLFRSHVAATLAAVVGPGGEGVDPVAQRSGPGHAVGRAADDLVIVEGVREDAGLVGGRSEEHTSELQSRFDLVCRLLLEKKRKHRI